MSNIDKNNRFEIIIEEINYWKSHKLLPETYCDYLLALYTNGKRDVIQGPTFIQKLITVFQILLCFMLLPFSFLVIYFTKFETVLQLTMLILFITYALWCSKYLKKHGSRYYPFVLVITLLILLLFSIYLGNIVINSSIITLAIIIINFIIWFYIGIKGKLIYLKFASIIGIAFSVFYTFL